MTRPALPITAWLDPASCPSERPALAAMGPATRELHGALDAHARETGIAWLHPSRRTLQRDLLGSPGVAAWQEAKGAFIMAGDGAWSELPHLYARYGTPGTAELIGALRAIEGAKAALVTDSGMQAVALVTDILLQRGGHAVAMRQVYNKTRAFIEGSAKRVGGELTLVDDGDHAALAAALRPETQLVFAESFTNPLTRAQDVPALAELTHNLVLDTTIATPWSLRRPALAMGARVVIGSLTKSLGGQDLSLGGYIATNDVDLANQIMDLIAMRGGILDDERAQRVVSGLASAERGFARRAQSAVQVAAFLASHPRIEKVFHPSRPDHPDAQVIARDYRNTGSLMAFRVAGADEARHRHIADVLVSCGVLRYALSFDGLATKVNHHRTVSEYFTPPDKIAQLGIDRLVRLGIGVEDADDLIACLNWTLHHEHEVSPAELDAWRTARAAELGLR
jgi:O-succinylhomoserine sulfhydrylase